MLHPPPTKTLILALLSLAIGCSGGEDEGPTPTPDIASLTDVSPWDNATVYFVMTDRFKDGDPSNNNSYGRELDGEDEVGTFHGGDLAGLTQALEDEYFNRLGVSALWITAPYEQVHGWVPGAGSSFKHYPYHGYYALDFTRVDANMGTPEEFKTFVDTAHEMGIRVIVDVVMNHPGYASIQDLSEFGVDVLWPGYENATLSDYYSYIDFGAENFANWWGTQWIRADLGGGYSPPDSSSSYTMSLSFLPDFKTESKEFVDLPPFYAHKADTGAVAMDDATVRDYLVAWLSGWVRDYGVDGFRCDTAKHVEPASWAALKAASNTALAQWRAENPSLAFPDSDYADPAAPFWMTGEVFPHGVVKDSYFDNGFDSLINFDFVPQAAAALNGYGNIDGTWADYAAAINTDSSFNVLSYLSSHDTALFFEDFADQNLAKQRRAGTLLLLTPGAVQIFYGDENARPLGPGASEPLQGTRSDYQWGENPEVLSHWRKVGQFRKRHVAVGAGSHEKISDSPYTFRRAKGDDIIYGALGVSAETTVDVSRDFANGDLLRDGYTGLTAEVSGGQVTFTPDAEGIILIERVD